MVSTGVISQLVKARGFGFIKCTDGFELFFHRSQVQGATFELLAQGQNAIFKVGLSTKGLQALDVRPMKEISTTEIENKNSSGKRLISTVERPSQPNKPATSLAKAGQLARK